MSTLSFGLGKKKTTGGSSVIKAIPSKRKAFFDGDEDEEGNRNKNDGVVDDDDDDDAFGSLRKPVQKSLKSTASSASAPRNSSVSQEQSRANGSQKYSNLSAIRSAKLQDTAASQLDSSVYEYDAVYDTFHDDPRAKKNGVENSSGPKYMTSLLASAEVRKRDQLRAKEKLLQKEREEEGDEFADKEKFVTGAYKRQQEEMRQIEEEEKRKEAEEEERRRRGGGMLAFNKKLLEKEEERQRDLERKAEDLKLRQSSGEEVDIEAATNRSEEQDTDAKTAARMNEEGARIVVNDDGEVVDKRQLLGAGLNVAPKKKSNPITTIQDRDDTKFGDRQQERKRNTKMLDARMSQRERQTKMVESQIEEIERKQKAAEEAERKEIEERTKSKLSEESKMSAKERFLQRKKEREAEAKKKAEG